jgi:hypothetical protein
MWPTDPPRTTCIATAQNNILSATSRSAPDRHVGGVQGVITDPTPTNLAGRPSRSRRPRKCDFLPVLAAIAMCWTPIPWDEMGRNPATPHIPVVWAAVVMIRVASWAVSVPGSRWLSWSRRRCSMTQVGGLVRVSWARVVIRMVRASSIGLSLYRLKACSAAHAR